jgi:hypothetical protein
MNQKLTLPNQLSQRAAQQINTMQSFVLFSTASIWRPHQRAALTQLKTMCH